jgi:hypothetical protein
MVKYLFGLLLIFGACTTYDLESEELILRPRILAVRVDPPEARIGQTVRLTPLIATPVGFAGPIDSSWLDCQEEGALKGGDSRDWCEDRDAEALLSRSDELVYKIPDDLPKEEVQSLSFTAGYWKRLTLEIRDRLGGEQDRAFKRLVVQPPARDPNDLQEMMIFEAMRNHNPDLPELEVYSLDAAGLESPLPAGASLLADSDYLFRLAIDKRHRQDYKVVTLDLSGIDPTQAQNLSPEEMRERVSIEDRRELLVVRYYRSEGKFGRDQRPNRTVESTSEEPQYYPAEITWALNTGDREVSLPGEIKLWFVVADGRGGMDWVNFTRAFEKGSAKPRLAALPPEPPPSLRKEPAP